MAMLPRVLFLIAQRAWQCWLPEFLEDSEYRHTVVEFESIPNDDYERFVDTVLAEDYDVIVLMSHHSTLVRDCAIEKIFHEKGFANTVCQPLHVAQLATNKREMAAYASKVPGLLTIPELSVFDALNELSSGRKAIVAKRPDDTEGNEFRVFRSADEFALTVPRGNVETFKLLQPFIQGDEYSLNILCDGDRLQVYEPIFKGETSLEGVHPCKRERFVPSYKRSSGIIAKLIECGTAYAGLLQARGLLELEFIHNEEGVHFLEVNPRLAATMRMVAGVSTKNMFAELPKMALRGRLENEIVPTLGFAGEFPLRRSIDAETRATLFEAGDISLSSRVTVYANSFDGLLRRMEEVRGIIIPGVEE